MQVPRSVAEGEGSIEICKNQDEMKDGSMGPSSSRTSTGIRIHWYPNFFRLPGKLKNEASSCDMRLNIITTVGLSISNLEGRQQRGGQLITGIESGFNVSTSDFCP